MEDRFCVHTACHCMPAAAPRCTVEDRLLLLLLRRPCAVLPSLPLGLSPSGFTGQTEAYLCASDMVCTLVLIFFCTAPVVACTPCHTFVDACTRQRRLPLSGTPHWRCVLSLSTKPSCLSMSTSSYGRTCDVTWQGWLHVTSQLTDAVGITSARFTGSLFAPSDMHVVCRVRVGPRPDWDGKLSCMGGRREHAS